MEKERKREREEGREGKKEVYSSFSLLSLPYY